MALEISDIENEKVIIKNVVATQSNPSFNEIIDSLSYIKGKVYTVKQLQKIIEAPLNDLDQTGICNKINPKLGLYNKTKEKYDGNEPIPVELIFDIEKILSYTGKFNTDINTNSQINAGSQFSLQNFFRRGEKISFDIEKSLTGLSEYNLSIFKRKSIKNIPLMMKLNFFKSSQDLEHAKIKETTNGISFELVNKNKDKSLFYRLSRYKNYPNLRQSEHEDKEIFEDVLDNTIIQSTKSAICFSHLIYNTTDDITLPTKGYFLKSNYELAGFGGDTAHFKYTTKHGSYFQLPKLSQFTIGITTNFGFIRAFDSFMRPHKPKKSKLNDRFFLGGIDYLPGFKDNSVNISDKTIGGDLILSNRLSLSFPLKLPYLDKNRIRGSLFASSGSIAQFNPEKAFLVNNPIRNTRFSVGAAVDIPMEGLKGSFRMSLSKALNPFKNDSTARFQFGFVVNA